MGRPPERSNWESLFCRPAATRDRPDYVITECRSSGSEIVAPGAGNRINP
jgi:hypothetical protein